MLVFGCILAWMVINRYVGWVHKRASMLAFCVLFPGVAGCMSTAQVKSDQLPVRRVVVYRNGVAYFERGGQVETEQVHFSLRKENVGDFLATLAVLEKGGQTVRSASFPVALETDEEPVDPQLRATLDSWDRKKTSGSKLRRVTLQLGKGSHELSVGYLAETPLWRPSYRLVVGSNRKAMLQAWGIVQNQSGEDWTNVEIALVAGAPIAFESTLGDPIIPPRPVVTDDGEVISMVPQGETTYGQRERAEAADGMDEDASSSYKKRALAPQAASMPEEEMQASEAEAGGMMDEDVQNLRGGGVGGAAPPSAAPAPEGAPEYSITPRDPSKLSRVQLQTGATRYEVPHKVTIPDKSATMVLLISKEVTGEAVYLFAPDHGVPDSFAHPFRVARFKNESGGMLERGPIAVFEKGAFLGQGMVDALPAGGLATVPFALMRSLSIRKEMSHDQRGARLYSIEMGELTIERDQVTIFAYHVENGDKGSARVLIKHVLSPGAKLWDPPKGTEKLAQSQEVLSPIDVPGFRNASLMLEERHAFRRSVDFRSTEARTAIRDYLKTEQVSDTDRAALELVLKHAAQLQALDDQETQLTREQRELEKSTQETRRSLTAIKDNQQAATLRRELTERLAEGTRRLDAITKDLVELRLRRTEQELRLRDARQGLTVLPPDRRSKPPLPATSSPYR